MRLHLNGLARRLFLSDDGVRLDENAAAVRHPIREHQHIGVYTYDRLIDRLHGVLVFNGQPGANPRLIQPLRVDDYE